MIFLIAFKAPPQYALPESLIIAAPGTCLKASSIVLSVHPSSKIQNLQGAFESIRLRICLINLAVRFPRL
jgi:hypothetical protein